MEKDDLVESNPQQSNNDNNICDNDEPVNRRLFFSSEALPVDRGATDQKCTNEDDNREEGHSDGPDVRRPYSDLHCEISVCVKLPEAPIGVRPAAGPIPPKPPLP